MTRTSTAPVVGATAPVRPAVSERLVRAGVTALGALPAAVPSPSHSCDHERMKEPKSHEHP